MKCNPMTINVKYWFGYCEITKYFINYKLTIKNGIIIKLIITDLSSLYGILKF